MNDTKKPRIDPATLAAIFAESPLANWGRGPDDIGCTVMLTPGQRWEERARKKRARKYARNGAR